jgi:hypothetical protein
MSLAAMRAAADLIALVRLEAVQRIFVLFRPDRDRLMPSSLAARNTRMAISERLATRIFLIGTRRTSRVRWLMNGLNSVTENAALQTKWHLNRLKKACRSRYARRRGKKRQKKTPGASPPGARKDLRPGFLVLEVGVLAVVALLPRVHHVVRTGDVALGVEGQLADRGLERTLGLGGLRNLLRVDVAGLGGRACDDLHGGVGVERVGFRLEAGGAELLDEFLAAGFLRGSGANVISVPSTASPAIEASSFETMPSPDMKVAFRPWSASWRMIRPASVCRPP